MRFRRASRPRAEINIAPIVDVVFLLVIFFAVSTTFLEDTAGLKLELPRSTSTARQEPKDLTVFLAADGTVSFGGRTLPREDLGRELGDALVERESRRVVLRADAGARHGDVVSLMDVIRGAGADTLTVAARPAEP